MFNHPLKQTGRADATVEHFDLEKKTGSQKSLRKQGEELGWIIAGALMHTHQRIQNSMKKDKNLSQRVNRIYQEIISQ